MCTASATIVACPRWFGDVTDSTTPIEVGRSPFDLMSKLHGSRSMTRCASGLAEAIDTLAMLRLFSDTSPRFSTKFGGSRNPPRSISQRLGIHPSRHIYTSGGGNMPQYLVNLFAEEIARGEMRAALIVGGEALRTQFHGERAGINVSWNEDPGGEPEIFGDERRGWSDHEELYGMRMAIAMYPLIENAIRGDRNRSVSEHLQDMGRLFARFAAVAAENPLATRRENYSAERLATIDAENPMGWLSLSASDECQCLHRPGSSDCDHFGRNRAQAGHTRRQMGFSPWLRGWKRPLVRFGTREARSLACNASRSP